MTTTQQILDLARAYAEHVDRRHYSRAQFALTRLVDAMRELPPWIAAPAIEPAAQVERSLAETMSYRVSHEDGHLVLTAFDGEDVVPLVMTSEQAAQLLADARRVLAAMESKS